MKKQMTNIACILLVAVLGLSLVSCGAKTETVNPWDSAVYTEDTELGTGAKTVSLTVTAEDKSVLFTVHTDKENLEDALTEHQLIKGEKGAYGLYVKEVNGILADYDVNQTYWGMNQNGESMMTGVSETMVQDGDSFEFIYTK